eukprot:CFRG2067T1
MSQAARAAYKSGSKMAATQSSGGLFSAWVNRPNNVPVHQARYLLCNFLTRTVRLLHGVSDLMCHTDNGKHGFRCEQEAEIGLRISLVHSSVAVQSRVQNGIWVSALENSFLRIPITVIKNIKSGI